MKIEVGDWVRFRGRRRIYEVQSIIPAQGPAHFLNIIGSSIVHRVSRVEQVAPMAAIKPCGTERRTHAQE